MPIFFRLSDLIILSDIIRNIVFASGGVCIVMDFLGAHTENYFFEAKFGQIYEKLLTVVASSNIEQFITVDMIK